MNNLYLYEAVRRDIQTGDCILWSSDTLLGKAIQFFCKSEINHVSVAIRLLEYDSDRVFVLEALEHGIVLRALSERLGNHRGKSWWYQVKAEPFQRVNVGRIALSLVGTKYDYGSLFRQALSRVNVDTRRLFCSEMVQYCYRESAVVPQDELALRPCDMPTLPIFARNARIL